MSSVPLYPLSPTDVLRLWEKGSEFPHHLRGELVIATAGRECSTESIGRLTIGQRDCCVASIRVNIFGSHFEAVTECPACKQQVEISFRGDEIFRLHDTIQPGPLKVNTHGYEVCFHAPTCNDLRSIAHHDRPDEQERQLFRNCISAAERGGRNIDCDEIPDEVKEVILASMGVEDPLADVQFSLRCPSCRHCWKELFDVVGFFWKELDLCARNILHDVHMLASAYGWSEREILDLSVQRRRAFLEMIESEHEVLCE